AGNTGIVKVWISVFSWIIRYRLVLPKRGKTLVTGRLVGNHIKYLSDLSVTPAAGIDGRGLDLPPGLRQTVKTQFAVRCKFIVRRSVSTAKWRSWTTADSFSLCRPFAGNSQRCLTSCTWSA